MTRAIQVTCLIAAIAFNAGVAAPSPEPSPATAVPEGSHVRFHLTAPLSSDGSKTGQTFTFVLLDAVTLDGRTVAAPGAIGSGTVLLAGKAGTSGHEGDLTLRIDSVPTVDGLVLYFNDQQMRINGKNAKAASALLGFVPLIGIASSLLRGSEMRIDTTTPIETTLLHPAVVKPPPAASPQPL